MHKLCHSFNLTLKNKYLLLVKNYFIIKGSALYLLKTVYNNTPVAHTSMDVGQGRLYLYQYWLTHVPNIENNVIPNYHIISDISLLISLFLVSHKQIKYTIL